MPKLVIYPGERKNAVGVTVGRLQVINGRGEKYEIAGGPPPGNAQPGPGGHRADFTPPGKYLLDRAEHHTTANWPSSVVPWGAPIRETDGIVEYQVGDHWNQADGPNGTVTRSLLLWCRNSNIPISAEEASKEAHRMFYKNHQRVSTWLYNDFGKWSWNLRRGGRRTAYFIHTTPESELATAEKRRYELDQSHGCIHVRPVDRDEMQSRGYLSAGIEVDVMNYGVIGPTA
jgi:hypothetical protein